MKKSMHVLNAAKGIPIAADTISAITAPATPPTKIEIAKNAISLFLCFGRMITLLKKLSTIQFLMLLAVNL